MDGGDGKNKVRHKTRVEDLERVVKMRKYQHCETEYSRLAKEPNTMPEVRNRILGSRSTIGNWQARNLRAHRQHADFDPAARCRKGQTAFPTPLIATSPRN